MRRLGFAIAILALSLPFASARADSLFNLSGDLTNGGAFQGTVDISTTGNAYVQGVYTNGATTFTLPTTYLGEQLGEGTYTTVDVFSVNQTFDLFLIFPQGSLVGYTGGALCALYSSCFPTVSTYSTFQLNSFVLPSNFVHLTATPATTIATTPEPAPFALLGTGLLAFAALRRRLLHD